MGSVSLLCTTSSEDVVRGVGQTVLVRPLIRGPGRGVVVVYAVFSCARRINVMDTDERGDAPGLLGNPQATNHLRQRGVAGQGQGNHPLNPQ